MFAVCRSEHLRTRLISVGCKYFSTQSLPSEYVDKAEYPPIRDLSFKARKKQLAESWHEQIRNIPTVEEKMIKINMPRYYGYKVVQLTDDFLPYNCLPATQHYTRTVVENLSANSANEGVKSDPKMDALVQLAQNDVKDVLEYAHDFYSHHYPESDEIDAQQREYIFTQIVVEQVNRALIHALAADYPHLHEVEIDYNPRHEAFWFVGGIEPPKNVRKSKEGREWQKEMANDPYDRPVQHTAKPFLALRHRNQLPNWKSDAESENMELAKTIPRYNLDPRTLGYVTAYQHGTNIPGFWPGSQNGFGLIAFHPRTHMLTRPVSYGSDDMREALQAQAIQASYGWLLAQANYNGFNTFCDITYPMNTQTVITNGRLWSFYEFQLNTLLLHSDYVNSNPRVNFCRASEEMELFKDFDDNGKCVGFNESVLRQLIKFFANEPSVKRSTDELQPYLGKDVKYIADYADADKREFLENVFKHMVSNRPRHLEIPEIYLWEKLYKIDNKTRQMEARRRFFELDINPWARTLNQHDRVYIPRAVRPEVPKGKRREAKFKKTYYP